MDNDDDEPVPVPVPVPVPPVPPASAGGDKTSEAEPNPRYASFNESVDSDIPSEAIDEADEWIDIEDDE